MSAENKPLWKSYELLISAVVGCLVLLLQWVGAFQRFELSLLDMRFLLRGPIPTDSRIVYMDMDEDGIKRIGRWPWSRDWHAAFVSVVSKYKPAALIFDVLFTEPGQQQELDDAFVEALRQAKNVYLPMLLESRTESPSKRLYPTQSLWGACRGSGHIGLAPDMDGVVRRIALYEQRGDERIPQVSFLAALDYLGVRPSDVQIIPGKWIVLPIQGSQPIRIPIDKDYRMIINWAGPWSKTFQHMSYYEILAAYKQVQAKEKPHLDLNVLQGKIGLIGLTATGLFDTKAIPFEILHPMVSVNGNILNNIFTQAFLRSAPRWVNLLLTFLFAGMVGCVAHWFGPLRAILFAAVTMLLGAIGDFWLFKVQGLIVDVVGPAFSVVFSYVAIVLYKFMTEEKKKRWIKMAFSHYLSPDVIEDILKNPDQLKLGGERHVITVLFSDVRSFTNFSEGHTPEEVVHMLNEYLDAMTKVILKNRGTIDKFVGDEIMALFGAPIRMESKVQARLAVKTALEMVAELKNVHALWQAQGRPLLSMGIGINTGEMICGNMGSTEIFAYTVIGDNVNIGARVEALTRKYERDIIITESTYDLVADIVEAEKIDSILVKGKIKPITIYAVKSIRESETV